MNLNMSYFAIKLTFQWFIKPMLDPIIVTFWTFHFLSIILHSFFIPSHLATDPNSDHPFF